MQITFNIPDAQVARVKAMVLDKIKGLDQNGDPLVFTDAEVLAAFKTMIRNFIKGEVQQYELLKEHEAVYAQYVPLDVTEV